MAIVIDEYGGTAGYHHDGRFVGARPLAMCTTNSTSPEPEIFTRPMAYIQMPGRTLISEINDRYSTGFPEMNRTRWLD
jgi:hypothetical protein